MISQSLKSWSRAACRKNLINFPYLLASPGDGVRELGLTEATPSNKLSRLLGDRDACWSCGRCWPPRPPMRLCLGGGTGFWAIETAFEDVQGPPTAVGLSTSNLFPACWDEGGGITATGLETARPLEDTEEFMAIAPPAENKFENVKLVLNYSNSNLISQWPSAKMQNQSGLPTLKAVWNEGRNCRILQLCNFTWNQILQFSHWVGNTEI